LLYAAEAAAGATYVLSLSCGNDVGLESNRVIALRLAKIARGGTAAFDEAQLMITEKIRAAHEATENAYDEWHYSRRD
jgi:hypothetical protein